MTPEQRLVLDKAIKMLQKAHIRMAREKQPALAFSIHGTMRELMRLSQELELAEKGKRFGAKKTTRKKATKKVVDSDPWSEEDK